MIHNQPFGSEATQWFFITRDGKMWSIVCIWTHELGVWFHPHPVK